MPAHNGSMIVRFNSRAHKQKKQMKHQRIIEIAKALKPIDWGKQPFHLTFAFKKNKLLCIGQNNPRKTNPRNLKYNHIDIYGKSKSHVIGIHSELSAIIKLGTENCSEISFYVVRIDNLGNVNYSKPCPGCLDMFNQVGYKNIFYTDKRGKFKKLYQVQNTLPNNTKNFIILMLVPL